MRFIILIMISLLFLPLTQADTTFFDNPDDAFIMGILPTSGVTGEIISGGTTGGGGCLYKWNCTNWSECSQEGKQTRNCTNIGTCSYIYKTPETEQNCVYTSPEVEEDKEEEINDKGITVKNKTFIYLMIILIILSVIFYLKKDYFKKVIQI
jgi:hypothetical protein